MKRTKFKYTWLPWAILLTGTLAAYSIHFMGA